jgi:hypothetical protein
MGRCNLVGAAPTGSGKSLGVLVDFAAFLRASTPGRLWAMVSQETTSLIAMFLSACASPIIVEEEKHIATVLYSR